MGYKLGPGLSFTRVGGHTIFIDIAGDRYFALTSAQQVAFDALSQRRQLDCSQRVQVERLIAKGILVTDCADVVPESCQGPQAKAESDLRNAKKRSFLSAGSALLRLATVSSELAAKPLGQLLDRLGHAKTADSAPGDPGDQGDAEAVAVRIAMAFDAADRIICKRRRNVTLLPAPE